MKRIKVEFFNKITDEKVGTLMAPLDVYRLNFFSSLYKDVHRILSNSESVKFNWIVSKVSKENIRTDRIILRLKSGTEMNIPANLSATDCKIIDLNLQALKLAANI